RRRGCRCSRAPAPTVTPRAASRRRACTATRGTPPPPGPISPRPAGSEWRMLARREARRLAPAVLLLALLAAPASAQDLEAAAHVKLGDAFVRQRAYDKAVEEYATAMTIEPRSGLLFKIGTAYERMGDLAHALSFYQQYTAVELEGDLADRAR